MKYLKFFKIFNEDLDGYGSENKDKYLKAMTPIDIDECVDYVIKNCTDFINNPVLIKRRINASESFKSVPVERKSRDNRNYYTLLIDNSVNWEEYPKRRKCFCCTLIKDENIKMYNDGVETHPSAYNDFLVIPIDNSKWGVCSNSDIYHSFKFVPTLSYFFDTLSFLYYKFYLDHIRDDDIKHMKTDILQLQNDLYKNFVDFDDLKNDKFWIDFDIAHYSYELEIFLKKYWGGDLFDGIENEMNPNKNNFKIENYADLKKSYKDIEVWTESPCVFIPFSSIDDFLILLNSRIDKVIKL